MWIDDIVHNILPVAYTTVPPLLIGIFICSFISLLWKEILWWWILLIIRYQSRIDKFVTSTSPLARRFVTFLIIMLIGISSSSWSDASFHLYLDSAQHQLLQLFHNPERIHQVVLLPPPKHVEWQHTILHLEIFATTHWQSWLSFPGLVYLALILEDWRINGCKTFMVVPT